MRIYIYTPQFFLRPKNTDWLYTRMLSRLQEFSPALDVYLQQSFWCSADENLRYALSITKHKFRINFPQSLLPRQESIFSRQDIRRAAPDVIYGQSPTNVSGVPIIFNCGPTYAEHMRAKGVPEEHICLEQEVKRRCAARATLITSNSQAVLDNLCEFMPEQQHKMRLLPFFLPHLLPTAKEAILKKFQNMQSVELLFVGRESRRKGLVEVLNAFQELQTHYPGKLRLRIVTNFADGSVSIPAIPGIVLLGEKSREEVRALLEESHILLMPSQFESYGWVYLEAMAAGTIPLACDRPTQQEILANGEAGLLCEPTTHGITQALQPYLSRKKDLLSLALASWNHCSSIYAPGQVAKKFLEYSEEAISL